MMAAGERGRGRPSNLSDPVPLHLKIPKRHYDYMTKLGTEGRLGVTEAEIATHILVRELEDMEQRETARR
jgi:hypothetical protein